MPFLLLGGTGQVGMELRCLSIPGNDTIVAPTRRELDLTDPQAVARVVASRPWRAVINAAAYTNVDLAEKQEAIAAAVNAQAPALLAAETDRRDIPLIHLSTDYVFDGRKGAPYVEQDPAAPLNAYGRTKLAGERSVRSAARRHVILRTSWVYSPFGRNFLRTILRRAAENKTLSIVADQIGRPTAAADIAKACLNIAIRCDESPDQVPYGTYHLAGTGEATWFEFAKAIVERAPDVGRNPAILPIQTVEYETPAQRPLDSRLDCASIDATFGICLRPWRESLQETMVRLSKMEDPL